MIRPGNKKAKYPDVARRINEVFDKYLVKSGLPSNPLIPDDLTRGKAYEAYVLALVVKELSTQEYLTMTLTSGKHIELKSSGGPINRSYPHIRVERGGAPVAEIWTDVAFTAYSCNAQGRVAKRYGDFHELDVLMTDIGADDYPLPGQIWLGVECKHTGYGKGLLKEILGVRRELGLLKSEPIATKFAHWPRTHVAMDPPACLLVYSSDSDVAKYSAPGDTYGIDFIYEPFTL